MTDPSGSEGWSYDAMGRISADQRTSDGVTRAISSPRNLDGSVASLTYPSGRSVSYTYGSSSSTAGRAISAVDVANSVNFATAAHYSPAGALAAMLNGSSISTTAIFNSRLLPCWIYATSGTALQWNSTQCSGTATAGNILDLKYGFNSGTTNNGDIFAVTNNRDTTRSQNFTYDSLNRIATAQTTSTYSTSTANCWAESYTIDAWGNLLNNAANPTTQSAYNGCSVEAPSNLTGITATNNRLSGTGFTTDSAGNLIANSSWGYSFDAENHLTGVSQSGQSVASYTYDGDGRRIAKVGVKLYWYGIDSDPIEETDVVGDRIQHHVYLAGHRVATDLAGVQNPGFEAGAYDWALTNASIITNASKAHSGSNYVQLSAAPPSSGAFAIQSGWVRVHPGQLISTFGGWVYQESGTANAIGWVLMIADINQNAFSFTSLNPAVLGTWTLNHGTNVTVPSNGYYARMYCQLWQPSATTVARCDDGYMSVDGVTYYAGDMLGTSRVMADSTGTICYDADYYPYGGERAVSNSCAPNYKFTGKERDSESGLDNFEARYMASSLGRFMSPDPDNAGAEPANPQSWNAYSYVLNNPLNLIDPDGLDCVYLNDYGTAAESIDHSSNQGECNTNGGYWANGFVAGNSSIETDPFSDNIVISSTLRDGQTGISLASQTWTRGAFTFDQSADVPTMGPLQPPQLDKPWTISRDDDWFHSLQFQCLGPAGKEFLGGLVLKKDLEALAGVIVGADHADGPVGAATASVAADRTLDALAESKTAVKVVQSALREEGHRVSQSAIRRGFRLGGKAAFALHIGLAANDGREAYNACRE